MSNGQGVGLKSQSLPFYNYCNLDKSKIKVDSLRKSTTWLSLTRQNTPSQALPQKAASGQLSSSCHGLPLDIFSTFTSWATRRGSYLTVLSYRLLQSLVGTHYSLARVVYGYLYKFLKSGSLTGLTLND